MASPSAVLYSPTFCLVKDYEWLPEIVAGLHFVAFACLMLARAVLAFGPGP